MTNYGPITDWQARINGREGSHNVAHIQVQFNDGSRVSIAIQSREVLAGSVVPQVRLKPVFEWVKHNETALLAEYERLNP
ncbi:MAG: DUF4160 domain-containing protein [Rhodoferax sp.]|nr:DUF4160 domain-containing protein [Rhodoferax sp.]